MRRTITLRLWNPLRRGVGASSTAPPTPQGAPSARGRDSELSKPAPRSQLHQQRQQLRSHLRGLDAESLAAELMRHGRRAAQASHVASVVDEITARSATFPPKLLHDALRQCATSGLDRRGVDLFVRRGRTHQHDPAFSLIDAVVECAFRCGQPEHLATVCHLIEPRLRVAGAGGDVLSELAVFRAFWRCFVLLRDRRHAFSAQSASALRGASSKGTAHGATTAPGASTERPMTAAELGRYEASCTAIARRIFAVLCVANPLVLSPMGAPVAAFTAPDGLGGTTAGAPLALSHRGGVSGAESASSAEGEQLTVEEGFNRLKAFALRCVMASGVDVGELYYYQRCGDLFWGTARHRANNTVVTLALIRASEASGASDCARHFFKQYCDRCAAAEETVDEIVIHVLLSSLAKAGHHAQVVQIANDILTPISSSTTTGTDGAEPSESPQVSYRPSSSVLALVMKSVAEEQHAATASLCLSHLLTLDSAAPSPYEVFTCLYGLAKCGVPEFDDVLRTCAADRLIEGLPEEVGFLRLQYALNIPDPLPLIAEVEASMAAAKEPLSTRMKGLVLQCLFRCESPTFLPRYLEFVPAHALARDREKQSGHRTATATTGDDTNGEGKRQWLDLLVLWSDRQRYELTPSVRTFIAAELRRFGLTDPDVAAEGGVRNQAAMLLHDDAVGSRRGPGVTAPNAADPRLFWLRSSRGSALSVGSPPRSAASADGVAAWQGITTSEWPADAVVPGTPEGRSEAWVAKAAARRVEALQTTAAVDDTVLWGKAVVERLRV